MNNFYSFQGKTANPNDIAKAETHDDNHNTTKKLITFKWCFFYWFPHYEFGTRLVSTFLTQWLLSLLNV